MVYLKTFSIRLNIAILLFSFILYLPAVSHAWTGKVVNVSQGDTITILQHGKKVRIHLYGVDCPEKAQAYGERARDFTRSMLAGRIVELRPMGSDRSGRTIAWVFVGRMKINLNLELLKQGLAWHRIQDSTDRNLAHAEMTARSARIGLWEDSSPIPPWEFRKRQIKLPPIQTSSQTPNRQPPPCSVSPAIRM